MLRGRHTAGTQAHSKAGSQTARQLLLMKGTGGEEDGGSREKEERRRVGKRQDGHEWKQSGVYSLAAESH